MRFGDSDAVQVADRVLAIGNPLGLGGSVTQGIVSALNRDISDTPFDDYIQTDAAINHGNSGGPLFNERGEVIGMNTAILPPNATSGSIGLGFAIPSNDVKYVADALRRPDGMRPGTLDFRIQQVTPEIADALNMPKAEGVIVSGTKEGGAASKCGLVASDIMLKYGTMPVTDVRAIARAVARTKPGTAVNLLIWRNDEPTIITATIEAMPRTAPPREDHPATVTTEVDPGWRLASLDDTGGFRVARDGDRCGRGATRPGRAGGAGWTDCRRRHSTDPTGQDRRGGGCHPRHRISAGAAASLCHCSWCAIRKDCVGCRSVWNNDPKASLCLGGETSPIHHLAHISHTE